MKIIPVAAILAAFAIMPVSEAMAVDGEKTFKKRCKQCHDPAFKKHMTGPNLAGIYGAKAGMQDDFKRYNKKNPLKDSGLVWDDATLDKWMENPKKLLKGTNMVVKVKKAKERAAIIEYLKTK